MRAFVRARMGGEQRSLSERIALPSHGISVQWNFTAPSSRLSWDLTIGADPGISVGEYLCRFNGTIDGSAFYLGLQTDVFQPSGDAVIGRGIGKGVLFSTWWSFDTADTKVAEGGFVQLGTHEGNFVGVRQSFGWTNGDYRVTLARADHERVADRDLDWFDLFIEPTTPITAENARPDPTGSREWLGALRFPRRDPEVAAMVDPRGVGFFEVYSKARTWADVPTLNADLMAYNDLGRCPSGRITYPSFPHGQEMPNADAYYDAARGRVVVRAGRGVVRTNAPGAWT